MSDRTLDTLANGNGGWETYRRLVVLELREIKTDIKGIEKRLGKIETNIAVLQVKAGMVGGGVSLIVSLGVWFLKGEGSP